MTIDDIKKRFPEPAKDIKLNLSSVLSEEGNEGLDQKQIDIIALACCYAIENKHLLQAVLAEAADRLTQDDIECAQAAAALMAMNNVYYRFIHLAEDQELGSLPAKLRMNMIKEHKGSKVDYELASLAVSAINACGMCIKAHVKSLLKLEVAKPAMQSAVRIASVLKASANALFIADNTD